MGAEKHNAKGAAGFLQLFDWNSKSRKKLFSNKSYFPDQSKQVKKSDRSLPVTRYDTVDEDECQGGSSVNGNSEYSCASSVVDDDGYGGARGPSVVARLMGLDTMPTSNCSEPSSTPFFGAQSMQNCHYQRFNMEDEHEKQMYFSSHLTTEVQSRSISDIKPRKMSGRPIKKFQSEALPPRSAKSIPITQHKLLSPIKSSRMFYTGDAAQIMEAAAKIIESGSQAIGKSKIPLLGSSSLPLKVKDLNEKVRTTREKRPVVGPSLASFRTREKDMTEADQEKISSGYSSTSFRVREKDRVGSLKEKTNIKYSSVSSRMKDEEKIEAIQEKTGTGYASSSFKMKNKESVESADWQLENGCNSRSFKLRDKDTLEVPSKSARLARDPEKQSESNAAKFLNGQSMNKSFNWSGDTNPFSVTSVAEATSKSSEGKSVSLAIQAKVNIQKREGARLNPTSSLAGQKEPADAKSNANTLKNSHKRSSMQNGFGVLRQNYRRQNYGTEKDMPSKPLVSKSLGKSVLAVDSASAQHKTPSKPGEISRTTKIYMEGINNEGDQLSSIKNVPRKKRNIDGGLQFEGNPRADGGLNKLLTSEANMDQYAWIEDSRKKGKGVVSFTFTCPMTRPTSGFDSPCQMTQRTVGLFPTNWSKKLPLNSECKNVVGSDELSFLLEQKLRELTTGIGLSSHDKMQSDLVQNFEVNSLSQDAGSTTSVLNEQPGLHTNKSGSQFDSAFQVDPLLRRNECNVKGVDEMYACSGNHAERRNPYDCRLPSPVSILEGSFSAESCNSSCTTDRDVEDSEPHAYVRACEVIGEGSSKRLRLTEADLDLSDSTFSISPRTAAGKDPTIAITANTSQSASKWERSYVQHILSNVDIPYENFSRGITPGIFNPQLWEQIEISKGLSERDSNSSKLERKLYLDCVGESLDLRCGRYIGGGCKAFSKGMSMVKRKDRLAEEVFKEITGLSESADCMVDELVDKDMSSYHGKWLNFEAEEFSLGVEVEGQILGSLFDDLVADILLH